MYLPSLVTHIIEKASQSEIVKKQLAEPDVDIFSNRRFGEKDNDFNFEFSDLVSVDNAALARAFKMTIDQNAVAAKTQEYMNGIASDITADVSPVKAVLQTRFKELVPQFAAKLQELVVSGGFDPAKLSEYVDEFAASVGYLDLTEKYLLPTEQFEKLYAGLLKGYFGMVLVDPSLTPDDYLATTEVDSTLEQLAVAITELVMKKDILTQVGGLTSYLSSSFAQAFKVDETALLSAFRLNFTEDELARVVESMFSKKDSTLFSNLVTLGYQKLDEPTMISIYFTSFDGKTEFVEFLDHYNALMDSYNQEDKVIEYNDATGILISSVKTIVDAVSYALIAFVSISLVVSSIMIGVITYISVYERTKEIGILRAIGASKRNISSIFNAETFIIGLLSGVFGVVISYLLIPPINLVLHHFIGEIPLSAALDPKTALFLIVLSVVLTLIAGLIPSRSASKKDPVEALRSE